MFRLLVVPHYDFQRIGYFHTTNKGFLHPMIYRQDNLPAQSTASFSIVSFVAEDEFNRKTRSSAGSGKV
jgi:hypothetical protein